MILTLTLAAGLFAASLPQAEPPNGWIILDSGRDGVLKDDEYPKQARPPKGWIILDADGDGVLRGDEYPKQAEPPRGNEWMTELGGHEYPK
jgi:hypothetical protein